jgi:hypothetical protein
MVAARTPDRGRRISSIASCSDRLFGGRGCLVGIHLERAGGVVSVSTWNSLFAVAVPPSAPAGVCPTIAMHPVTGGDGLQSGSIDFDFYKWICGRYSCHDFLLLSFSSLCRSVTVARLFTP